MAFDVVCMSTAGGVRITVVTSGPRQQDDDGYLFQVDGGDAQAIGANASVTVTALPAGDHVVGSARDRRELRRHWGESARRGDSGRRTSPSSRSS